MGTRLRHVWLGLRMLPRLLLNRRQRHLLGLMRAFCRRLPAILKQPLPQAMTQLTIESDNGDRPLPFAPNMIRDIADLAALLERNSPLGLCLRRSLTRYAYLRPKGVPVAIQFGAKFTAAHAAPARKIAGHAWLTLNGRPYFESQENWRDYVVMFTWPDG